MECSRKEKGTKPMIKCPECKGRGWRWQHFNNIAWAFVPIDIPISQMKANGGRVRKVPCPACSGAGMEERMERTHCNKPDRDVPAIVCGYSLPCPYHTAIIHADKNPPTVEIPVTFPELARPKNLNALKKIAQALEDSHD